MYKEYNLSSLNVITYVIYYEFIYVYLLLTIL